MEREYNEIYGYMPQSIINQLPQEIRYMLFLDWLSRKPTDTGWLFVDAVVEKLGDEFIAYLFKIAIESIRMDGEIPTKENVKDSIKTMMEEFATDINVLYFFVNNFRKEQELEDDEDEEESEDSDKQPRDSKGRFMKKRVNQE